VSSSESSASRDNAKEPKKRSLAEETPKPLWQRPARSELVWDGKYDTNGRRVAPLRVALPFQTVETVNESAQDRQRNFQFGPGFREEEWRNRLIWGDKKYVLPSLLPEFAGNVNLIYIDRYGGGFLVPSDGAGRSGGAWRRFLHVHKRAEHY
jgi:hypothetical protein